jgi:hypothetical protein
VALKGVIQMVKHFRACSDVVWMFHCRNGKLDRVLAMVGTAISRSHLRGIAVSVGEPPAPLDKLWTLGIDQLEGKVVTERVDVDLEPAMTCVPLSIT